MSISETSENVKFQENMKSMISVFHSYGFQPSENVEVPRNKRDENIYKLTLKNDDDIIYCPKCKQTFSKLSNLKRHMKNIHQYLMHAQHPSKNYLHKCDVCEKFFKSIKSLQAHNRRIHKKYRKLKKHKCPLCPETLEKRNMSEHFKMSHRLLLRPVKVNLGSYEEFCEWKKAIERVTKTYFTKQHTHEKNGTVFHMFICHRSGTFKSVNENKRKLKAQGSKKIDAYCPAAIKATVTNEGKCEVMFQTQHLGHENELQHLSLTHEERKYVADKLATNLPLNDILSDIHNSALKVGSERLCLLTKKDLHNIKTSLLMDKQLYLSSAKLNENLINCLRDIHNKHADSVHVKADITKIEKGWVLTFLESNEIYLIKKKSESCDCSLICTYCKMCIKLYACSCPDSSVKGNMCKHIHFFCMEMNKMHVSPVSSNSTDCNNDNSLDFNNDSLKTEIISNTEQSSGDSQTSNSMHLSSESSKGDKANTIFINSERRNTLKNNFSELINSITTEEEYKLFEGTVEELTVKLKSTQSSTKAEDKVIIPVPAVNHPSLPVLINKNKQHQNNSNLSKATQKALILQIHDPSSQDSKYFYILEQNNTAEI